MSIADRMRCCASLVCRRPWPPPKAGRRWPPPGAAWAPRSLPRAPPARLARRRARPALARCQYLPRERERGRERERLRERVEEKKILSWELLSIIHREGKGKNKKEISFSFFLGKEERERVNYGIIYSKILCDCHLTPFQFQ